MSGPIHEALADADIAALAEHLAHHRRRWEQVDYVQFTAVGVAGQQIYSRACDLVGWALVGSGVAATFFIADGPDAGAVQLGGSMSASANGNAFSLAPLGVRFHSGILVKPSAGTITGAVFYRNLARG